VRLDVVITEPLLHMKNLPTILFTSASFTSKRRKIFTVECIF